MQTEWIALEGIETAEGRRPVDQAHVKRLAASIKEIGLQTPITVMARKDVDGWRSILVAGAHRLAALRLIGESGADCFVLPDDQDTADLWEIDENLARSELTDAERADHHKRREQILKDRGLVSSHGGQRDQVAKSATCSYAKQAAADLGVSERSVRQHLTRGKKIEADVLAEVAGTPLDKGVVLDELARTAPADQHDKLAEIAARYKSKLPLAADPLNDLEATEKQLAALMSAWNRAGPEAREKFLETIDGPVFDRGQR